MNNFWIIVILCAICYPFHFVVMSDNTQHAYFVLSYLLFSFSHVNIFHLAVNIYALYLLRPRTLTLVFGYLFTLFTISVLWLLFSFEVPTSGLSILLYASAARSYASWQKSILLPIAGNIPFILINYFTDTIYYNWQAHIFAFISSYLFWHILYYPLMDD